MGLWPGAEHYRRRYDYCSEYVTIMRELWATGRSNFKGDFFTMDDCRCSPMPSKPIPIICAAQSDAGTRYAAHHADYNFCNSFGVNQPTAMASSVARLVAATEASGRTCSALILTMIIADETDAAAMAKWEHYKAGIDLEAIAWRDEQAGDDPNKDPFSQPQKRKLMGGDKLPTNQGVLVGSYARIAAMLDEVAAVPGVEGVMMTFDDFVIGMEQFGTRILPLMRSRAGQGDAEGHAHGPRTGRLMPSETALASSSTAWRPAQRRVRLSPAAISWLQVSPLALILLVLFALPTLFVPGGGASSTMTASASIRPSCSTTTGTCSPRPQPCACMSARCVLP